MNLPPSITRVSDEASPRIGPLRFSSTVDPESLTGRHLRRPTPFGRIFRTLDTITESASVTTRFVDGPVVEEPGECIPTDQNSPPATPLIQFQSYPSRFQPPRPPPRRSTEFRRANTSPENTPPPSAFFPRRTIARMMSMSNQVLLGTNITDELDAEALRNIWWIYAEEAHAFDQRTISGLHKSLDVRLVFSGIFSAVLTPFIVESYKLLENLNSSQEPTGFFGRNGYKVRVNAMWFGSLILSLMAGLFSIHCKQWLDGYEVDLVFAGSASSSSEGLINACRLRQYRYQGMQRYHIPQMIGLLPVLLYGALSFFAIGLVDFLWHLNQGIAIFITILCLFVVVFHIVTTIIPCFTTRSPFKTPLSNLLGNLWRGMWQRCHPKGLMEHEERLDADGLGTELDANSFKWLMKHTQSEDVYQLALRAERAFLHQSKTPTT